MHKECMKSAKKTPKLLITFHNFIFYDYKFNYKSSRPNEINVRIERNCTVDTEVSCESAKTIIEASFIET